MGITENTFMTGIGSYGAQLSTDVSPLKITLPGKPGSRIFVNRVNVKNLGAISTAESMCFMKVLNAAPITVAGTAAGTSGVTISTADFAFGSSHKYGDATDSLAANDIVVWSQTDGTFQYDEVANVSTDGYITMDTALPGLVDTNDKLYIFGLASHNAHLKIPMSTLTAGKLGDTMFDCAVAEAKGDPMVVTDYPVSSSGVQVECILYSYINK